MYQLASPMTEWGAPGAYTRRCQLFPNNIPVTTTGIVTIQFGEMSRSSPSECSHSELVITLVSRGLPVDT